MRKKRTVCEHSTPTACTHNLLSGVRVRGPHTIKTSSTAQHTSAPTLPGWGQTPGAADGHGAAPGRDQPSCEHSSGGNQWHSKELREPAVHRSQDQRRGHRSSKPFMRPRQRFRVWVKPSMRERQRCERQSGPHESSRWMWMQERRGGSRRRWPASTRP